MASRRVRTSGGQSSSGNLGSALGLGLGAFGASKVLGSKREERLDRAQLVAELLQKGDLDEETLKGLVESEADTGDPGVLSRVAQFFGLQERPLETPTSSLAASGGTLDPDEATAQFQRIFGGANRVPQPFVDIVERERLDRQFNAASSFLGDAFEIEQDIVKAIGPRVFQDIVIPTARIQASRLANAGTAKIFDAEMTLEDGSVVKGDFAAIPDPTLNQGFRVVMLRDENGVALAKEDIENQKAVIFGHGPHAGKYGFASDEEIANSKVAGRQGHIPITNSVVFNTTPDGGTEFSFGPLAATEAAKKAEKRRKVETQGLTLTKFARRLNKLHSKIDRGGSAAIGNVGTMVQIFNSMSQQLGVGAEIISGREVTSLRNEILGDIKQETSPFQNLASLSASIQADGVDLAIVLAKLQVLSDTRSGAGRKLSREDVDRAMRSLGFDGPGAGDEKQVLARALSLFDNFVGDYDIEAGAVNLPSIRPQLEQEFPSLFNAQHRQGLDVIRDPESGMLVIPGSPL